MFRKKIFPSGSTEQDRLKHAMNNLERDFSFWMCLMLWCDLKKSALAKLTPLTIGGKKEGHSHSQNTVPIVNRLNVSWTLMQCFSTPWQYPNALYIVLSFTTTFIHQWVIAAMQGTVYPNWEQLRFRVLPKDTSKCGQLELEFEPPTLWLSVHRPLFQLSHSCPSGGSVILWGCFSASGTENLMKVEEIIYKEKCVEILKGKLQQWAVKMVLNRHFIFEYDNHPKHTSFLLKNYLLKTKVNVMEWPAQSPDLDPIENIWSEFKKNSHVTRPSILNFRDLPKKNGPGFLNWSVKTTCWRLVSRCEHVMLHDHLLKTQDCWQLPGKKNQNLLLECGGLTTLTLVFFVFCGICSFFII